MAHTYGSCLYHIVFSTAGRAPMLQSGMRERCLAYVGGIARENGFTLVAAGGVENHIHLLLALPPAMAPSKAVQLVKGGSSKWIRETFPEGCAFRWQEGYGVFTVGFSQVEATKTYLAGQEEHHRRRSFQEEYLAFLERHGIESDPRYTFD